MSQDYPSQFGRNPAYSNPGGTIPAPPPPGDAVPVPQWYQTKTRFAWILSQTVDGTNPNSSLPTGFSYIYTWTSPVFDLRPDLRSGNAGPKEGVPIWRDSARLQVQVFAPHPGTVTPGLSVLRTEFANTNYAYEQVRIGEGTGTPPNVVSISRDDVSAQFAPSALGATASVLAGFAPPGTTLGFGEGYPVRWWRLSLLFAVFLEEELPLPNPATAAPTLYLQAKVY